MGPVVMKLLVDLEQEVLQKLTVSLGYLRTILTNKWKHARVV
jgi:hypothetical protein